MYLLIYCDLVLYPIYLKWIITEKIKVYIEQPTDKGFADATCILPEYSWQEVHGFSQEQINSFQELIEKGVHVIYKFAKQGGFGNAANL